MEFKIDGNLYDCLFVMVLDLLHRLIVQADSKIKRVPSQADREK